MRLLKNNVIKIRDLPDKDIENIIIDHLKKTNRPEYPINIALKYSLDPKKVIDITNNLIKQGKIKCIED